MSPKWTGQGHVTHSRISDPFKYLWNGWSRQVCVLEGYIECYDRPSVKTAWLGSCDRFKNFHPLKFLWNGWR